MDLKKTTKGKVYKKPLKNAPSSSIPLGLSASVIARSPPRCARKRILEIESTDGSRVCMELPSNKVMQEGGIKECPTLSQDIPRSKAPKNSKLNLHDQLREQDGPHEQVGVPQSNLGGGPRKEFNVASTSSQKVKGLNTSSMESNPSSTHSSQLVNFYVRKFAKSLSHTNLCWYACPCTMCNGYIIKSFRRINKHFLKYGPSKNWKETRQIQKWAWKHFYNIFLKAKADLDNIANLTFNIACPPYLESQRIKGFDPKINGGWQGALHIPIDQALTYYMGVYRISQSTIEAAGLGIFTLQRITNGTILFPYIGTRYNIDTWRSLCVYYPRMRTYAIEEDSDIYLVGDVLEGNIAGYINSSFYDRSIRNVDWVYNSKAPPWRSDGYVGYIETMANRDIELGEELFTFYEFL